MLPDTRERFIVDEVDAGQDAAVPVGGLIRDVQRAWARTLGARIAREGVTMGQWYFLKALWEGDGLTQRELSYRVGMMEPTTVTAVSAMERRGLVVRVRNVGDRRKMNVFLTERGRQLKDRLLPMEREVSDQAAQGLSADMRNALNAGLATMLHNLSEEGGAADQDGDF